MKLTARTTRLGCIHMPRITGEWLCLRVCAGMKRIPLALVIAMAFLATGCALNDGYGDSWPPALGGISRGKLPAAMSVVSVNEEARQIVVTGGKPDGVKPGMFLILSRQGEDYGRARIRNVFRDTSVAEYPPQLEPKFGDAAVCMGKPTERVERRKGNIIDSGANKPYLLDIGHRDGVKVGMLFTVMRDGMYMGQLSVTEVYDDVAKAVARDGQFEMRTGDLVVERGKGEDALLPHKAPDVSAPAPRTRPPGDPGWAPYPQR